MSDFGRILSNMDQIIANNREGKSGGQEGYAKLAEAIEKYPQCKAELAALRAERDRLREFADDVRKWSEAYPTNIFTEPTPEQVDAVCKTLGFRLDRIAAMVLREFTKPWGDAARAALGREA